MTTKPTQDTDHVAEFAEAMRDEHGAEIAQKAADAVAGALVYTAAQVQAIERQHADDDIPVERQFFSVGHACQLLGISPVDLRRIMRTIGVRFAEARNEVAYLDGSTLVQVAGYLREYRQGRFSDS